MMANQSLTRQLLVDLTGQQEASISQKWVLLAMQRHGAGLLSMLWRILGNEQDVCDAYQDTFFRLAHVQEGKQPDNIKAYLFRTASNTAISMLRQKNRFDKACHELAQRRPEVHTEQGSRQMELDEVRDQLRRQLARLPEHLREVVVLRDLGELSYAQISAMLGISGGTARVYRTRAIKLLGRYMSDRET